MAGDDISSSDESEEVLNVFMKARRRVKFRSPRESPTRTPKRQALRYARGPSNSPPGIVVPPRDWAPPKAASPTRLPVPKMPGGSRETESKDAEPRIREEDTSLKVTKIEVEKEEEEEIRVEEAAASPVEEVASHAFPLPGEYIPGQSEMASVSPSPAEELAEESDSNGFILVTTADSKTSSETHASNNAEATYTGAAVTEPALEGSDAQEALLDEIYSGDLRDGDSFWETNLTIDTMEAPLDLAGVVGLSEDPNDGGLSPVSAEAEESMRGRLEESKLVTSYDHITLLEWASQHCDGPMDASSLEPLIVEQFSVRKISDEIESAEAGVFVERLGTLVAMINRDRETLQSLRAWRFDRASKPEERVTVSNLRKSSKRQAELAAMRYQLGTLRELTRVVMRLGITLRQASSKTHAKMKIIDSLRDEVQAIEELTADLPSLEAEVLRLEGDVTKLRHHREEEEAKIAGLKTEYAANRDLLQSQLLEEREARTTYSSLALNQARAKLNNIAASLQAAIRYTETYGFVTTTFLRIRIDLHTGEKMLEWSYPPNNAEILDYFARLAASSQSVPHILELWKSALALHAQVIAMFKLGLHSTHVSPLEVKHVQYVFRENKKVVLFMKSDRIEVDDPGVSAEEVQALSTLAKKAAAAAAAAATSNKRAV